MKKDLIVSGSLLQPYITLTNGGGLPIGTRLADVLLETTVPAGETFTLYTETASLKMLDYFDVREASVQTRIVAPVGESTLAILEETAAGTGAGEDHVFQRGGEDITDSLLSLYRTCADRLHRDGSRRGCEPRRGNL